MTLRTVIPSRIAQLASKVPRITFWRVVVTAILIAGAYSAWLRFHGGLGASTALSDRFPWGLWIGFDVLCGVALAAGGFTISALVYVFHGDRFRPIIRPTILTAFLGYSLVIVALLFDLGRPYAIWHPLVMRNPHSVMFEVAWCVMLYSTVLALEFSPMLLERLRLEKLGRIVHMATIPLVILGVILSMLHQSSLGSLYLIVPSKLHPLWYSPLLPVFFFVSAMALGCAMTIFESFLSFRAFGKRLEIDLLSRLGKIIVVILSVYLVLRIQDLMGKGALGLAFEPTYAGRMFLAEILLGVVAPIVLLSVPKVRANDFGLFVSSVMVVLGFVMNRLDITITGIESYTGVRYFPSWTEVSLTVAIVTVGFLLFRTAVKHLPVFPAGEASPHGDRAALPVLDLFRKPYLRTTNVVFCASGALVLAALLLGLSGIRLRSASTPVPAVASASVDIAPALEHFKPVEVAFHQADESPGLVTFRHKTHVDAKHPSCSGCHDQGFPLLRGGGTEGKSATAPARDMHGAELCGRCHDGTHAFKVEGRCGKCHKP